MSDDLYQEIILEEAKHPQNKGKLENADVVLKGLNASCGDQVEIFLKLSPDKKTIIDLKWQGHGCAISQSAMSLLSAKVNSEQLTLAEVSSLTLEDILELLGLDSISPGRMKCVMLGMSTLKNINSKA